jgi:sortase (surface protein transpeptidase)
MVLIGLVAWQAVERARSGSDAARFNYEVAPGERAALLGQAVPPAQTDRFTGLYPGDRMNPKYWDEPLWAGSAPFGGPAIPSGFEPVSSTDLAGAVAAGVPANRMRIPAIGLDSAVTPLAILNLDDAREYETPNNVVGFIPETALPGQPASGWYFGHLQSIVQGEGSVFHRLPEVADLVREDPVDIILETPQTEYLYRVTSTRQVHQSQLAIRDSKAASITLVTCWPPRVYDQRILVNAELIAVRRT